MNALPQQISFRAVLAALAMVVSVRGASVFVRMDEGGTGVVCRVGSRQFDFAGLTNHLSTSEMYDGREALVFMGVAPDVKATYVASLLSCLRSSGFKSVFWFCDVEDDSGGRVDSPNPWDVLPMWFFMPWDLGKTPVVDTFNADELGLVAYSMWEKTYVPRSIEDAVNTLKNNLSASKKARLQTMSADQLRHEDHVGLGKWMRVNWVLLESNSRLRIFFYERRITFSPYGMSWVVLNLLQRDLKGEEINYSDDFSELAKTFGGTAEPLPSTRE